MTRPFGKILKRKSEIQDFLHFIGCIWPKIEHASERLTRFLLVAAIAVNHREMNLERDTQCGDSHLVLPIRPRMVRNMDDRYQAFNVKPGEKLYLKPKDRLSVW